MQAISEEIKKRGGEHFEEQIGSQKNKLEYLKRQILVISEKIKNNMGAENFNEQIESQKNELENLKRRIQVISEKIMNDMGEHFNEPIYKICFIPNH